MAKGYWIGHILVTQPEKYPEYAALAKPAVEKYGGRYLVRGGQSQLREGEMRERHVVVEFESYEQAVECYESEEYAKALALRHKYSMGDFTIVEGAD